jgi:hypothetical protein
MRYNFAANVTVSPEVFLVIGWPVFQVPREIALRISSQVNCRRAGLGKRKWGQRLQQQPFRRAAEVRRFELERTNFTIPAAKMRSIQFLPKRQRPRQLELIRGRMEIG